VVSIVAIDRRISRRQGVALEDAPVFRASAAAAPGPRHSAAVNLLCSPWRNVIGGSGQRQRFPQIECCSCFKVSDVAQREERPVPIFRVHQRIAYAKIHIRCKSPKLSCKRVAPVERNASRAQSFRRISRRQSESEGRTIIHCWILEREQELTECVANSIRRSSRSRGSRSAHEKKWNARIHGEMLVEDVTGRRRPIKNF